MLISNKTKNLIFIILFSIFIAVNFLFLIGGNLIKFQEALMIRSTSGIPIYLNSVQIWVYNIISLFIDSIFIAIAVGILGYFFKKTKTYMALVYGVLIRYGMAVLMLILVLIKDKLAIADLITQFGQRVGIQVYVLFVLQLLAVLYFSYLGFNIGKKSCYLDKKDEEIFYLNGISKKIWVLLIVAYNPIAHFLSKLTIVQIYTITKNEFWINSFHNFLDNILNSENNGVMGFLIAIALIPMAWSLAIYLFKYGLDAIKDKKAEYRWIKICFVFIVIPAIILIIPINRTWFF